MKFLKLHFDGKEVLVNMSIVSEIYNLPDQEKSILYFNFVDFEAISEEQASIKVDESLDEIYEQLKRA